MLKEFFLWFLVFYLALGKGESVMAMSLKSPAFNYGEEIPIQYTCDGNDISPPLMWDNIPEKTKSFVLIMDDPDAPGSTWDHWILYNLYADVNNLPENIKIRPIGSQIGSNSWKRNRYNGPCPPPGHEKHRYYFKLYALDNLLDLGHGAEKSQLLRAMQGHILEKAEWMGYYKRK